MSATSDHSALIGKRFASDTRTVEVVHHGERRPKLCTVRVIASLAKCERGNTTGQMLVRDVLALRPISGGQS